MITLNPLDEETLKEAVRLKISCWTEELSGVADNDLSFDTEYAFWLYWKKTESKDRDVRTLLGESALSRKQDIFSADRIRTRNLQKTEQEKGRGV